MKSISTGMDNHLNEAVTTICTCWKITRQDGVILGFTDHDAKLVIDAIEFSASSGYYRSAIANSADTGVDNLDVSGFLDDDNLNETELRNGAYDYAQVEVFAVNWADLTQGPVKLRYGYFGEVMIVSSGFFKVELRGLTQLFAQTVGETYAPECRADLGDHRCKVELVPAVRRSNASYKLNQRMIVPDAPGLSFNIPIKNPGFEIQDVTYGNAWTAVNGRITNQPLRSDPNFDPYVAHETYRAITTGEAGSFKHFAAYYDFPDTELPSFEVDMDVALLGHEVNISVYWADDDGVSAGDPYQASSGWFTPSLGTSTQTVGPIPATPGSPTGRRIYWTVEWRNDGSLPSGTAAQMAFSPYPMMDDEVIPHANLGPSGLPMGSTTDWVWDNLTDIGVSGPNVWLSPYAGDWHLSIPAPPQSELAVSQIVSLDVPGMDMAIIDAGGFEFQLNLAYGAETAGVLNGVSFDFFTVDGVTPFASEAEPLTMMQGHGFWTPHSFKATVPPTTRRIQINLHTKNYTNNAKARGVWDNISAKMFEPSYENQDNFLAFNGVEFKVTTAGVSAPAAPDFDYTLGAHTTDGSVVFQAVVPTHMITATITAVYSNGSFAVSGADKPDNWFQWGVLEFLSGLNLHKKMEIRDWNNTTKVINTALKMPYLPIVGEKIRMHTGCAKSREVCKNQFDNILNYRGEPDVPGTDQYFKVGGANTGGSSPPPGKS